MRLYGIQRSFFNFDQDRDAWEMRRIVAEHKPTLIGPDIRRGRLKFFIGPYHYYFFLPSLVVAKFDPIGPIVFGGFIGALTTIILYFVAKEYFNEQVAIIAAAVHAGSFYLSEIERMPWNPFHIFYLMLLLLFCASKVIKGKPVFLVLAAVIFGLLLQAHPTIIFLFPMLVYLSLYVRRKIHLKSLKFIFSAFILLGITFLPLLLFDLRHGFINLSLMLHSMEKRSSTTLLTEMPGKLVYVLSHMVQEFLNLFSRGTDFVSLNVFSWLVLVPIIYFIPQVWQKNIQKRNLAVILLMPFIIYLFAFTFFLGDVAAATREGELQLYYFLPVLVCYVLILSNFINRIMHIKGMKFAVIFCLVVFCARSLLWRWQYENPYSYENKHKAVRFIIDHSAGKKFSVNFIDKHAYGYLDGFRYLFSLYGVDEVTNYKFPSYNIQIPADEQSLIKYGNIGVEIPSAL